MAKCGEVEKMAIENHYLKNKIPLAGINDFIKWLNERDIMLYSKERNSTTTWRSTTGRTQNGKRKFYIQELYEWFKADKSTISSRAY